MIKSVLVFVISSTFAMSGFPFQTKTSAEPGARRVEVTAKRYSFDPGAITLKKGEPVLLVLRSADVQHGLRFRELGLEVRVPKGGTGEIQFTPDKVGDFVGHCYVFCGTGHGTMTLTLHVVS